MNADSTQIDKELQEVERDELNHLINKGLTFTVRYTITKQKRSLPTLRKRTTEEEHAQTFEIKEPTLAVLDRLSALWLDMTLDESKMNAGGADTLEEAKRATNANTRRMADIIATAALGEDYHVKTIDPRSGRIQYCNDDKELTRLSDIFFHTIKPSELVIICNRITNISNLGDFIGSMRYMSGARTTQPKADRIE